MLRQAQHEETEINVLTLGPSMGGDATNELLRELERESI